MFLITYLAMNDDECEGYESRQFALKYPSNPDDAPQAEYRVLFKELPENIREAVENTYDGVWEPNLDTIKVYKVEKIEV